MSWTTPKTWAVGDPATSADLNTYVRDNTNWLYDNFELPNLVGTIWYGSAPPSNVQLFTNEGLATPTVGSGGSFTITLPNPYTYGFSLTSIGAGGNSGNVGAVQPLNGSSSLSTIGGNLFTPSGGTVASGATPRIIYRTIGA